MYLYLFIRKLMKYGKNINTFKFLNKYVIRLIRIYIFLSLYITLDKNVFTVTHITHI